MTLKTLLIIFFTTTVFCHAVRGIPNNYKSLSTEYENTLSELYIAAYSNLAVAEMKRMAIPASIILAQGMLESGYGKSELAIKANNHFGIKCHKGWAGETYVHLTRESRNGELVARQACFRQYATVEESYKDHSEFLASRSNYVFLFLKNSNDFRVWARGLQQAGYATDIAYADKLIMAIEKHALDKFDTENIASAYNQSSEEQENKEDLESLKKRIEALESILYKAEMYRAELRELINEKNSQLNSLELKHESLKKVINEKIKILDGNLSDQYAVINNFQTRLHRVETIQQNIIKSDPLANYFNQDGTPRTILKIFPTQQLDSEGIFYQSGRKATVVEAGKNLLEIAIQYDIKFKDLLRYNDLDDDTNLSTGYYVYLEQKANYVENNDKPHQVIIGETVHTISQRYGIKASKIYQRNHLKKGEEPAIGEFIFLNKQNEKQPKIKNKSNFNANNPSFNAGGSNR